MPPLSATTERVKPFLLVPVKKSDIGHKSAKDGTTNFCQDGWLEKVSSVKNKTESEGTKNAYDGHSYQEELRQYIAESSANLLYDYDEPLRSSDEDASDEDSDPVSVSPRNAEIIDFSASIVSISSDKTDEYVQPPVEVPRKYRTQDRQGGVLVAGHHVLFTNWAFKRQMRHMGRLGPLPERGEAQLSYIDEAVEEVSIGMYSGKIVEL